MFKAFKRFKNYSIIIFFYFFFFLTGDLIFSNFIYNDGINIKYNCFEYKNYVFNNESFHDYYLQKNCTATETQRMVVPYKVFTDQNGYRYSGKKRPNKKNNLVFLGDSTTYGMGAKFENSYVGIIEEFSKDYGVYNLAIPGYGIQKYYYTLSEFLKNKKASKIFLFLDMTDIHDAVNRWTVISNTKSPVLKSYYANKKINNWKKMQNSNFKGSKLLTFYIRNSLRFLKQNLKLKFLNTTIKRKVSNIDTANFTYTDENKLKNLSKEDFQKSIKNIDLYFEKISDLAKKNEAELFLVIFPWSTTLIYGQDKFNWEKFGYSLCKKNKCSGVVNLFKDFEEVRDNNEDWMSLIYIHDDVHFKKFGNNLIANKIINEINN